MPFRKGIMTGGVFGLAPDPPTGGSASSGANGQSVLTWSAPVNDGGGTISDYLVRYSTDNSTWSTFADGGSASTGATVTGLTNGTLYYFQVAAVNAYGTSGYSSSFSGTPSTVPNAPTGGAASSNANAQSVLTWTAPAVNGGASITDYVVQYSTDNVNFNTFADGVNASTGATVTSLTNGTLYYFRVAAINARGTGAYSASFSATPSTVPSAVQSLSLSGGDRSITATWSAPASNGGSGITSYTVETQLNSDGWVNQGSQSSGVSFTVRNTTAVTARSYKVRVTANNANGGTSTESGSASAAFGSPATPSGSSPEPSQPSSGNGTGNRSLNVTYSPLACSAFDRCEFLIARWGYGYEYYGNYAYLNTTSSAAGQTYGITVFYQVELGWYSAPADVLYLFKTRTYNTDGDYIDSAEASAWTPPTRYYYEWVYSYGNYTSGTVAVNANTYSVTTGYAGNADRRTDSVSCTAWSTTGTATICTSSRYFSIAFSNGTTGTYSVQSQLQSPFSTNSGQTRRSRTTGYAEGFGGATNSARVQIRGEGSISSGWSPTISVFVSIDYTDRVSTLRSY